MRRIALPVLALAAVLSASGCVTSQTVEFPGKDFQAVFNASVGALCGEKRIIVFNADAGTGIVQFVFRGQMGHQQFQLLVAKGANGPTVTIPFPPNARNTELLDAIAKNLSSGAPAPRTGAPSPARPAAAPAAPAAAPASSATPADAPAAPLPDAGRKKPLL